MKKLIILIAIIGVIGLAIFLTSAKEPKMGTVSSIGDTTFDDFKILQTGTITLTHTANSESSSAYVTHGLGFAPTAIVYELTALDTTTAKTQLPYSLPILASSSATHVGKNSYSASFTTASNTLTVSVFTPNVGVSLPPYDYASAFTLYYKYYILRERSSQ